MRKKHQNDNFGLGWSDTVRVKQHNEIWNPAATSASSPFGRHEIS